MGATLIWVFLIYLVHRMVSGVRNGSMYNPKSDALQVPVVAAWALPLLAFVGIGLSAHLSDFDLLTRYFPRSHQIVAASILAALSGGCSVMALQYRSPDAKSYEKDLHLWTQAEQMLLTAGMVVLSPWAVLAVVLCTYPAVFMQKGIINRFVEEDWFFNGTDDPTGKYYGLPSLGIRIPRTTQRLRLWLSLASIFVFVILIFFEVELFRPR